MLFPQTSSSGSSSRRHIAPLLVAASLVVISLSGCRLFTRGYACESNETCGEGQICVEGVCESGTPSPEVSPDGGDRDDGGLEPGVDGGNEPGVDGGNEPDVDGGNEPGVDGGNEPGVDGGNEPDVDGGNEPGVDAGNEPDAGVVDAGAPDVDAGTCTNVNFETDPDNCGFCGNVCGGSTSCIDGFCDPRVIATYGGGEGKILVRENALFFADYGSTRQVQRIDLTDPFFGQTPVNTNTTLAVTDIALNDGRIYIETQGVSGTDAFVLIAPIDGPQTSRINIGQNSRGYGAFGETLAVFGGSAQLRRLAIPSGAQQSSGSIPESFPRGHTFSGDQLYWVSDANNIFRASIPTLSDTGSTCGSLPLDLFLDVDDTPSFIFYAIDTSPNQIVRLTKSNCSVAVVNNDVPVTTFQAMVATDNFLIYALKSAGDIEFHMQRFSPPEERVIYRRRNQGTLKVQSMAFDFGELYWLEGSNNSGRQIKSMPVAP